MLRILGDGTVSRRIQITKTKQKIRYTTRAAFLALEKEVKALRKELETLRNEVKGAEDGSRSARQAADAALYVTNYCRR